MAGSMALRRVIKAAAAAAIHYSGMDRAIARAARLRAGGRRVLVLAYHRVVEDFEAEAARCIPGLLVSRATFARQIEQLHRAGYELAPLERALEVVAGTRPAARDLAVITFDDGYRDVYEVAFPLLRARGVPATVYLATAYVGGREPLPHDRLHALLRDGARVNRLAGADRWELGLDQRPEEAVDRVLGEWPVSRVRALIRELESDLEKDLAKRLDTTSPACPPLLDWEMCRAMARGGIAFGAHTVNHAPLHLEPLDQVEREIRASKEAIERELGTPCRDFAYPNGYYNREVVQALAAAGFRSAVTTEDLPARVGGDAFRLPRKTLWENHSRGALAGYSEAMTACQIEGVFGWMGLVHPVPGERPPRTIPSLPSVRDGPGEPT